MINEIEVASRSRENVAHTLYLDEKGKAIGCSCEHRQFQGHVPCGHMNEWNTEEELKAQDQAFATSQAQFKVAKEARDAEAYAKRLASQVQAAKDAERTAFNYYELYLGI